MNYSKKTKEELIKEIELLKKKEETISTVLYNINEMFYKISFDKKGKKFIEFVSPQVETVLGLTVNEYINHTDRLIEHFHPEEIDSLTHQTNQIKYNEKESKTNILNYRFYHKKHKKYIWIEETVISILDNNKIIGFLGTVKDVTENINKEKQLEFILENLEECIYNVKFEKGLKRLNYISNKIEKITGLTPEEFEKEGKSGELVNRIHPDDIDMINNHIEQGLYKERKNQLNKIFRFKPKGSKEYLWIEESVYPIYNNDELSETTTVLRDITESKNIELKLKESEELYRTFSDISNELIIIHDNGKVIEINKAVIKILGFKPEELVNKSILKLATKESKELIKKNIEKNFTKPYEVEGFHKNGNKVYLEITSKPITWKGKELRAATVRDITKKKTFELHLKENEEKYRNIFSKNLAGVYITERGKIIECNNSFAKIFGYKSRVQLIGKNAVDLYFKKSDRDKYIKDLTRKKTLTNYRIKHKKSDGSELWILTNVTLNNNKVEGTLIEITDEIKKEELNKEKLRAKLAEENNQKLQKEINERIKIEKKLVENQKYTSSIINNSLDIICASNMNGNIIELNKSGMKIFGFSDKDLKNVKAQNLYKYKSDFLRVSKQLQKTGKFVGEITNVKKNGKEFTSFLSASLLYDQQGNEIGSMGISRDITELKEAEQQLVESEEKYRDLFENATDLIQSVDVNGKILYVNNAWKNKLGYSDKELENKNIFEIIHPDCKEKCAIIFSEIVKSKPNKATKVSYELQTKEGNKIIVEGNVSLKYKVGKPDTTRAILRDVTNEIWDKTIQNVYNNITKIISETEKPDQIYEGIRQELGKVINTEVFIISYSNDNNILSFPYYYDKYTHGGIYNKEDRIKGNGINEYFLKLKKSKHLKRKELDKIIGKGEYQLIGSKCKSFVGVPLKIKNNIIGVLSVQSYSNENEFDNKTIQILEFISGALALTVQKKYDEAKIQDQSSRLRAIIESSSHLFWTYEKDKGLTSFNKNYSDALFDLYNQRPVLEYGKKVRPQAKELYSFWDEKYNEALSGKQVEFVTSRINKNGNRIIRDVFLNPIFDENNNVSEVSGIAHDITEKTLAEEQLKESLKEKEVLLKEVHHRVKNNLQVISSILNLQSSYVTEEQTLNILRESQNRIKSMAFIHESLYQTNDFSQINFSEYVVSLSKNLVHSYELFDNFVGLKLQVKDVSLNLDQSIPCGLLINELISNALKYAFPNNKRGTITIGLAEKEGSVYLCVKDNGVGLPEGLDYRNTDSLGLQLVMTLTEQIGGTIELDNTKGANYSITFKKD